jgi:hypothetical protein
MNNTPIISSRQADTLLQRYYDGLTDENEEYQLRRFLASAEADGGKYDADRAVMGLLLTGRALHRRGRNRHRRLAVAAVAAAACLALMAGLWHGVSQPETECIAYIHGERTTNPTVVEAQMRATLSNVAAERPEQMVRDQLNEVLNLTQ